MLILLHILIYITYMNEVEYPVLVMGLILRCLRQIITPAKNRMILMMMLVAKTKEQTIIITLCIALYICTCDILHPINMPSFCWTRARVKVVGVVVVVFEQIPVDGITNFAPCGGKSIQILVVFFYCTKNNHYSSSRNVVRWKSNPFFSHVVISSWTVSVRWIFDKCQ